MPTFEFRAKLERPSVPGAWTFALIPAKVVKDEGLRPRQRVKGSIDGHPFKSSLIPRGGGTLFLVVNGETREQIGKEPGQPVEFSLSLDSAPPTVELPAPLAQALRGDPMAKKFFDALAPSHRKSYADWIASAKQPETVARRVDEALKMLRSGVKSAN